MATINGIAIVWGLPDFGITESTIGSMIPQSFDHSKDDSEETIKDRAGITVSEIYPDPVQDFTLEFFVKGTGIANAKLQTKLPPKGTLLTLTFTSTEYVAVSTGAVWTLKGAKQSGTNTSAVKISLNLKLLPQITAQASA